MRRILGMSAAALLLASCGGPDAEGTIETEDGDVSYTVDGEGDDVSIDIEGPDGEQVSVRGGDAAGVELPDGFSLFPDAEVVTSTTIDTSDGKGALVVMTADASPEQVIAFYRQQAEAAGVKIEAEINTNGNRLIGGESEDGVAFSVNASPGEDGASTVQLTVGRGL